MKKLSVFLGLFLSVHALAAQSRINQSLQVFSVERYMNTPVRIGCDDFEKTFSKYMTRSQINQADSITAFDRFVKNAQFSRKTRLIDVRRKYLYSAGENSASIIICSDGNYVLMNGRTLKRNKRFLTFLNSMVKE